MTKRKAANGSGTIIKRKDGRYEGRYVVGNDPGTGKLIRRSVYASTQSEYRKKYSRRSFDLKTPSALFCYLSLSWEWRLWVRRCLLSA